jgi:hypothetical protein
MRNFKQIGRSGRTRWAIVLTSLLSMVSVADADIIKKEDMLRGITITRTQCEATPETVWVNVDGRDFCVRYYLSSAGGEGRVPVVFLQGDHLGNLNLKTLTWIDPSEATDIDTESLMRTADGFSKMAKTTAIYLARIGVDGTSGNHMSRKTLLELHLMNAALDAIKQRYGFLGFHLVGQSGGSRVVGGLIELRHDIACAVVGSGPLAPAAASNHEAGRAALDPGRTYFDVTQNIADLAQNRALRIMLVTDPADKTVPLAQQAGFVNRMRQAGRAVPEFMVEATDEKHHGVGVYSQLIVAGCALGKTNGEIASAVGTIVKHNAEYNARRQKELSSRSDIAAAAARQISQDVRTAPDSR